LKKHTTLKNNFETSKIHALKKTFPKTTKQYHEILQEKKFKEANENINVKKNKLGICNNLTINRGCPLFIRLGDRLLKAIYLLL
jgi:hypothetical protein